MKFAIITHVNHNHYENQYYGYAPYVREMNIWLKYVDEIIIVAPINKQKPTLIDIAYQHQNIDFLKVPDFSFTSFKNNLEALLKLPMIFWKIFWAMKKADHIHLRCPGNMGLVGCLVQILFPKKIKTAKYAGNWDPKSNQPWTYKLQQSILRNTFLTRNMQVLVYGEWENETKNVKSFFTASYSESEIKTVEKRNRDSVIEFIFVGSLTAGKNPMYAINLIETLVKKGHNVVLNIYGEGVERKPLTDYIVNNQLDKFVFLHGNQNSETVKKAYQKSHFAILPSKSEGWPKAIAEGMFWGCVPIATKVSCVPFMLDFGNRGILIDMNLQNDSNQLEEILADQNLFFSKSKLAAEWSQNFTTDKFDFEIKNMLAK
ncbi:glycosyltransferase [Flavobacterium daemonense]|uniref:glycosyltransferase n=1 Tax=Flavobacterium daemonense TaxID=1393049 RepID=UPI0011864298|nr:glycosyltransferase [Flavobacterium daemonense]KAF2333102.1 glycosyltransferase [Flavobacterium daemonense]